MSLLARTGALDEYRKRCGNPAALASLGPVPTVPPKHGLFGGRLLPAGHPRREGTGPPAVVTAAFSDPAGPEAKSQVLPAVHQRTIGVRP